MMNFKEKKAFLKANAFEMKARYEEVTITPQVANTLLTLFNDKNPRGLEKRTTVEIAKLLEKDKNYILNEGTPIRFDSDFNLIDGQHRLMGIVLYGKSVQVPILWNVSDVHDTIDRGRKRSDDSVLKKRHDWFNKDMRGMATVRLTLQKGNSSIGQCKRNLGITLKEIEDELVKNKDLYIEVDKHVFELRKKLDFNRGYFPKVNMGGIYAYLLLNEADSDAVRGFFEKFSDRYGVHLKTIANAYQENPRLFKTEAFTELMIKLYNANVLGLKSIEANAVSEKEWFLKANSKKNSWKYLQISDAQNYATALSVFESRN